MMLKPLSSRICIRTCLLLCLILTLHLAAAHNLPLISRAADLTTSAATTTTDPSSRPVNTANPQNDHVASHSLDSHSPPPSSHTLTSTQSSSVNLTRTASDSLPTSTSSTNSTNSTLHNLTIPPDQLPITPRITPGWAVAGVIMILTGFLYAFVGIKNPWIHAFFSTAYVAALGVSVLIVYVMNLPVNNALQGGYIAAAILTGCTIGTAAIFFKELIESLGCALGGFCIAMWLLCLRPAGLVRATAPKAIFIACFTLFAFSLYFSRFTRDTSMIILIAFAGATISVLGIDCFSCAGLKEFWAYIWSLNDNLFPYATNTYPVTRGMRVETAAIIIIFLIATMSQIRLWKIVRKKREKRAALRAQHRRDLDHEEEHIGRQIEQDNARDRAQWERVYRDGAAAQDSLTISHLSDTGHVNEKERTSSTVCPTRDDGLGDSTEMGDVSERSESTKGQLMTGQSNEGAVTVRVAADEYPDASILEEEHAADAMHEKEAHHLDQQQQQQQQQQPEPPVTHDEKRASRLSSHTNNPTSATAAASHHVPYPSRALTPTPQIVPLPFNVPQTSRPNSQRSSVATFADAQEEQGFFSPRRPQRNSVVKRLSQGSADLLRSLSQRSARSNKGIDIPCGGQSTDELVLTHQEPRHQGENDSIAATMDDESVSADDRPSMDYSAHEMLDADPPKGEHKLPCPQHDKTKAVENKDEGHGQGKRESIGSHVVAGPEPQRLGASPQEPQVLNSDTSNTFVLASLKKEQLPSSLSRVALSYRTNEWAKHVSKADLPAMDKIAADEDETGATSVSEERVRPVNMQDLKRTADNGTPPPAAPRSGSRLSMRSLSGSRPNDAATTTPMGLQPRPPSKVAVGSQRQSWAGPSTSALPMEPPATLHRLRASPSLTMRRTPTPRVQPIPEEEGSPTCGLVTSWPEPAPGPASIAEADFGTELHGVTETGKSGKVGAIPGIMSFTSPQTLLGQREMFLKRRSQGNLMGTVGEMQAQEAAAAAAAARAVSPQPPPSDAGSLYNYSQYNAAALASDLDDVPLRQRRSMLLMTSASGPLLPQGESSHSLVSRRGSVGGGYESGGGLPFSTDSDAPSRRHSGHVPSQTAREAQLANFRRSVSQDLNGRSGSPLGTLSMTKKNMSGGAAGHEVDFQRHMDVQRQVLLGQREVETQRREMQRREREHAERAFDNRMRSGDMLEAHREAMRKMQRGARGR